MKVLVVSYSRNGTTRTVGDEIALALSADHREIVDVTPRRGLRGYWRSGLEALARGLPSIRIDFDPGDYDAVVVGSPVWTGTMASPMRTFLFLHGHRLRRPAFFCTLGGRGAHQTLDEMMAMCGLDEAPTFWVRERDLHRGRHAVKLKEFTTRLQRLIGILPAAA